MKPIRDLLDVALGLSRSQLHRHIKEQTHLSVTLFIRQRRLEKAKDLLLTSSLRISEVADLVGIANPQNFSKKLFELAKNSFYGSPDVGNPDETLSR